MLTLLPCAYVQWVDEDEQDGAEDVAGMEGMGGSE